MGQIKFTTAELQNVIDARYHSFIQDIADSAHTSSSPQSITGGAEYRLTIDGLLRNSVVAPTHLTNRWDSVNNKMAFTDELNTPTYVGDLSFVFDPALSAAGIYTIRIYIDDATPKLIRTYTGNYKGSADIGSHVTTWYIGEETGYDAKNDGIYFTLEFDANGDLYNKGIVIYRT